MKLSHGLKTKDLGKKEFNYTNYQHISLYSKKMNKLTNSKSFKIGIHVNIKYIFLILNF